MRLLRIWQYTIVTPGINPWTALGYAASLWVANEPEHPIGGISS